MDKFMTTLLSFWNDVTSTDKEKGATATEYALLVALIAIIIVAGVGFFGRELNSFFNSLGSTVAGW